MRALVLCVTCAACTFEHGARPSGDGGLQDAGDARVDTPTDAGTCAVAQVVAGAEHTCARTVEGAVYCWGRGNNGELGVMPLGYDCTSSSPYYCSTVPRRLELATATALGGGNQHTCATTPAGAFCWGVNLQGAFGDGTLLGTNLPRAVPQRNGASVIDGGVYHTCSVAGDAVLCSGQNAAGEVGNGSGMRQATAVIVTNAQSISLGDYTSCVTGAGGTVSCWGRNAHGQIDTSVQNRLVPTPVTYVTDVVRVAAGRDHICALRSDMSAACWGNNTYGQLGNGMTATYSGVVTVAVPNVVDIAVSRHHGCVRDGDGAVWCFGEGYTPTPTKIALPSRATSLAAGAGHDCAITETNEVRCWGNQNSGQLGNGTSANTRTLTPVLARICE